MTTDTIRRLGFWKLLLAAIVAVGAYAIVLRYARGLGAITNLSDEFPWGIWIGFDLLVGVGLAAGGFVIAATVHLFRWEKYESIARPTILTAFLGYLLVIVALLIDLGRPWNIWHPIIMWNPHSVMFEVAWCVMLYTTVLALEFSPVLWERLGWQRPLRWIRALYIPLVIAGVLLSTMHQSSLGTLYVIAPDKLHELWYTPLLPAFFFISAIAAGLAMTIFESYMSHRAFGKRLEGELLEGLGRVIVVVLAVYAVWRCEDLLARGAFPQIAALTPESVLFWGEVGLGVLLPMLLFALPAIRRNEAGMFFAAVLTVLGFIVNRMNVAITGMSASSGVDYFPAPLEFAVTVMLVACGFVAFGLATKYLPVFPSAGPDAPAAATAPVLRGKPVFHSGVLAGLWVLLLFGVVAVGYTRVSRDARPPSARGVAAEVPPSGDAAPAPDLALPADWTFPPGEDSPGPVVFRHGSHVDPSRPACAPCHRDLFLINEAGTAVCGDVTYERVHEGDLCRSCHDGKAAFDLEDDCAMCHGA